MKIMDRHFATLAVLIPLATASFSIDATADGVPPKGDFLQSLLDGEADTVADPRRTTRIQRDDSLLLQRRPDPSLGTPPQRRGRPLPEWNEPQRPTTLPWDGWEQG